MHSRELVQEFYRDACALELRAFKPGNVSIYAAGHGMQVADFLISATVSSAHLVNLELTLGERIYYAVQATRSAVGCNTNLGILLLCAPLIEAALRCDVLQNYQAVLTEVLQNTSVKDADWVFKAITAAAPGGLGSAEQGDVIQPATMTLLQAMQLAAERDRIALQYVSNFKDVFDFGVIRYNTQLNRWGMEDWAAVAVYTGLLSQFPDSHVERKYGGQHSAWIAAQMLVLDQVLLDSKTPESLVSKFSDIDTEFKCKGINPGTTADLTVATVLTVKIMSWLATR